MHSDEKVVCESHRHINTVRSVCNCVCLVCESLSCEVAGFLPAVLSAVIEQFDHV